MDEELDHYRPWGTWALVAANVFLFLSMNADGVSALLADANALRKYGGVDAALVWDGEVWRLLTACFVHGAIWHIALNVWVLLQVGRILERVVGPSRVILIYLVSGVFGFGASLLSRPGLSVGASGAIFGLVGALVALAVVTRKHEMGRVLMSALAPFVIATFVIGMWLDFVDNGAHFGGFLAGFLLGYGFLADAPVLLLALDDGEDDLSVMRAVSERQARGSTAALVALLLLFCTLVPYSAFQYFNPEWAASRAWTALARNDVENAKKFSDHATELARDDAEVTLLRARLNFDDQRDSKAAALYAKAFRSFDENAATALSKAWATRMDDIAKSGLCRAALKLAQSDHEVLNNCAWHWLTARNLNERRPAAALALAQRARDLYAKPDGTFTVEPQVALAYLHTLAVAWSENGDTKEAEAIMERAIAQELGDGWLNDRTAFARAELSRLQQKHADQRRKRLREAKRAAAETKSAKKAQKSEEGARIESVDGGPLTDHTPPADAGEDGAP